MGQLMHDPSLCERAKRCIFNKEDCSSLQHDRKHVRFSSEDEGPPVDGSVSPTAPRQDAIDLDAPNPSPRQDAIDLDAPNPSPRQDAIDLDAPNPSPNVGPYPNFTGYDFVPIPDSDRQDIADQGFPYRSRSYAFVPNPIVPNRPRTYTVIENPIFPVQAVPNRPRTYTVVGNQIVPDQDVSTPSPSEQAISNSRHTPTVDEINEAAADIELVDEFATVLAVASQIPLHQAAAIQRPVRFTVNQSMAPSPSLLFLQATELNQQSELLSGWEPSEYADIRINETSFTLGDDSDNQPLTANQTATPLNQAAADQALVNRTALELAATRYFPGADIQVTAAFFVVLYSVMFRAGGIPRETVRRWIQSGNARLPIKFEASRLANVLPERRNGVQTATRLALPFRSAEAIENEFQGRMQLEQQSISLSQQEQLNGSSLRHSRGAFGAVERLNDEYRDSDATTAIPYREFLRASTNEVMYNRMVRDYRSRSQGSRPRMDGASSDEDRRMQLTIRGRRNAIQFGVNALYPGNNVTVTYSGPPDVDNS
ncbi:hypothetical protein EAE96_009283 [Botrytis aclada]|nr:hypothetical protein EAE96_009283 [Botrytis aclada]